MTNNLPNGGTPNAGNNVAAGANGEGDNGADGANGTANGWINDYDDAAKKVFESLQSNNCFVSHQFVRALFQMGSSTIEKLKCNAYILSAMSDSPCLGEVNQGDSKDDVHGTDKIDRRVALILKKDTNDNFTMVDVSQLMEHLDNEFRLNERSYTKVVNFAKDGSEKINGMPAFATAVQYLKVWIAFIKWSCDFASVAMTMLQVKTLIAKTEKILVPMFDVVRGPKRAHLGLRNFVSEKKKFKGTADARLDQMLIEYRHHMMHNVTRRLTPKELKCLVIGIPQREAWGAESKAAITQNKELKLTFPNYNFRSESKIEFGDKGDKVHTKGTLNEQMIRRLWEIACALQIQDGNAILTSCTHKQHVPRKDNTVPVLLKKKINDNDDDVVIHEHYIGNFNSIDVARYHLRQQVKEQQLATLVVDYPWVDNSKDKQCENNYTSSKFINDKYTKKMFSEVIPMLARMSFLSDDGTILLPHHPWIMANVYINENKYRCLYDIDFVNENENTLIDTAHKNWQKIAEASYSCKGDQRQYHLDQDMSGKKQWMYEKMISYGKVYDKAVQLYGEQWDFIPAKEVAKIRWVWLKPKKNDLDTKLNWTNSTEGSKKNSKFCIRPNESWSTHKEHVEKVEQKLKDAQKSGSEQPTLILGLTADRHSVVEQEFYSMTKTDGNINYDAILTEMIGDNAKKTNLVASTLLRWSIF